MKLDNHNISHYIDTSGLCIPCSTTNTKNLFWFLMERRNG